VFIGVSGTTIANKLNPNHGSYDPTFPKPIKEEKGRKTFLKRDIQDWLDKQREEHV
jgi:predicted DNA-binding transcriptional regulator AlpA